MLIQKKLKTVCGLNVYTFYLFSASKNIYTRQKPNVFFNILKLGPKGRIIN